MQEEEQKYQMILCVSIKYLYVRFFQKECF